MDREDAEEGGGGGDRRGARQLAPLFLSLSLVAVSVAAPFDESQTVH